MHHAEHARGRDFEKGTGIELSCFVSWCRSEVPVGSLHDSDRSLDRRGREDWTVQKVCKVASLPSSVTL